LPANTVSLVF